jgi:hypothetical protein
MFLLRLCLETMRKKKSECPGVLKIRGSRAAEVCAIDAPDAEQAVKAAVKLYKITDRWTLQSLIAWRVT